MYVHYLANSARLNGRTNGNLGRPDVAVTYTRYLGLLGLPHTYLHPTYVHTVGRARHTSG